MIKRFVFIGACFLLMFTSLNAQDEEENSMELYRPTVAVKWIPLALMSRTPAFQIAVEAKTFSNQAVQVEFGYLSNLFSVPDLNFKGIKLRSEYRYYRNRKPGKSINRFWAIQHMYKSVDSEGSSPVWRFNQTYQEILPLTVKNQTNSIYLVAGRVLPFGKNFFFEMAYGLGVRILKVSMEGLPEDGEINRGLANNIFDVVNRPGTYQFPTALLSFKLVYAFGNTVE